MKKFFFTLFFILLQICNSAFASEELIDSLKKGKKIVFIRHALAPGSGDPKDFKINDCLSQRNLNEVGIKQSEKIGIFFKINKIKIDRVLSSEWCRCKDTAQIAFGKFETFNALNSFYDERFAANEFKQIEDLKYYIKNWNSNKNLVLVTHFVVISSMLNISSSSGEIIISDKNLKIIGAVNTF